MNVRAKWAALLKAADDTDHEARSTVATLVVVLVIIAGLAAYVAIVLVAFTISTAVGLIVLGFSLYWAVTRGYRYATKEGK